MWDVADDWTANVSAGLPPASDAQELANAISELATLDGDLAKTFQDMEVRWTGSAVRTSTCLFPDVAS